MDKFWMGPVPARCDVCHASLTQVFSDIKTSFGRWGCLCPKCAAHAGDGYGYGKGQQYTKQPDGRWKKTLG